MHAEHLSETTTTRRTRSRSIKKRMYSVDNIPPKTPYKAI